MRTLLPSRAATVAILTVALSCESGKPRGAHAPASAILPAPEALPARNTPAPSASAPSATASAPSAAASAPFDAGTATAKAKTPCNVALIGDSLTDYRAHGGGYVRYLEQRCPASQFQNFAKGGAMVNQMRAHFEATLASTPRGRFSHVVIFGGVNDLYSDDTAGRTTKKIEADLTALYAGSRALGARVVAITVAPWGGFTRYFTPHRAGTTRELNAWILAQAADGSVDSVADAHTLLSCGDADRICERYDRARSDGLHFGKAGHEVLGAALYEREFHSCP